eukprot:352895-Chlamydomonas_euryale.AAC.4
MPAAPTPHLPTRRMSTNPPHFPHQRPTFKPVACAPPIRTFYAHAPGSLNYGQLDTACTKIELTSGSVFFVNMLLGFQIGAVLTHSIKRVTVMDAKTVALCVYMWQYGTKHTPEHARWPSKALTSPQKCCSMGSGRQQWCTLTQTSQLCSAGRFGSLTLLTLVSQASLTHVSSACKGPLTAAPDPTLLFLLPLGSVHLTVATSAHAASGVAVKGKQAHAVNSVGLVAGACAADGVAAAGFAMPLSALPPPSLPLLRPSSTTGCLRGCSVWPAQSLHEDHAGRCHGHLHHSARVPCCHRCQPAGLLAGRWARSDDDGLWAPIADAAGGPPRLVGVCGHP